MGMDMCNTHSLTLTYLLNTHSLLLNRFIGFFWFRAYRYRSQARNFVKLNNLLFTNKNEALCGDFMMMVTM